MIDAGSAAPAAQPEVVADPASGATTAPTPTVETLSKAYSELKAKYEAAKSETDGGARKLLFAALLAAALKYALDGINFASKYTLSKQLAWVALGLAVPIALLSKYAGGAGWFDALLYAGAGPGAIVVHELIARFKSRPAATA